MKSQYKIKLLSAIVTISFMYFIIYHVHSTQKTPIYKKIKTVLDNPNFLFLISIVVIIGIFDLSHNSLKLTGTLLSFVVPMALIVIDI